MKDGYLRVAAATPRGKVADVAWNVDAHLALMQEAKDRQCALLVFPELSVTAYTCGDLFWQEALLQGAEAGLARLVRESADLDLLCVAGVPVRHQGSLYNCGAVFHGGRLLGLVPKCHIPNYGEFYELRYFTPGAAAIPVVFAGQETWLGTNLLFACETMPEFVLGVEICEDLWAAAPPSTVLAQSGATVIANLSCSDETVGKADYRRNLVATRAGSILGAYVYSDAGMGESTTDMVFAGHNLICENGRLLAESPLFSEGLTWGEVDLGRLLQERRRRNTWQEAREGCHVQRFAYAPETAAAFVPARKEAQRPFVPTDENLRAQRCEQILTMQAAGLMTRLGHIGCKDVVLGLSGGLDSTLALLVCMRAFQGLGLDVRGIHGVSMPGLGTTARTRSNAWKMAEAMGCDFREISIEKAVRQHFEDIGHDGVTADVTYENAQARERTQILMDLANQFGGIVIGTGDLSELALGWATYNGDHMSMYGVNSAVPKTLIRHLVQYAADASGEGALKAVLYDVLDTPVSPELLPPKDGEIAQETEEIVGPYLLHDYVLYYMLRYGFSPGKIFRMAQRSFAGTFDEQTILHWMTVFYRRFFAQQFKRSCLPDGPKIGSVSLSPRGDYRMPSDAVATVWLAELAGLSSGESGT